MHYTKRKSLIDQSPTPMSQALEDRTQSPFGAGHREPNIPPVVGKKASMPL